MYYCQHQIAYCNNLTFVKVICHQIMNKSKYVLHWDFLIEKIIYIYIFARGSFMWKEPKLFRKIKILKPKDRTSLHPKPCKYQKTLGLFPQIWMNCVSWMTWIQLRMGNLTWLELNLQPHGKVLWITSHCFMFV